MVDEAAVTDHYAGEGGILARIDDAFVAAGLDPTAIGPDALAGVDEFHLGGRLATLAVTAALDLRPGHRVLDVGCGIGGVARSIAREHGCVVHGVDLTPAFVEVATALSARVEMADTTSFEVADALTLPVPDEEVDAVVSFHVGMNIADKHAWLRECARVVRPGGSVLVYDIAATGDVESLVYPQPWAADPATSRLASPDEYVAAFEEAGLAVTGVTDRSELVRGAIEGARAAPPPVGLGALMGPSFPAVFGNLVAALDRGLVAPVDVVARRPV